MDLAMNFDIKDLLFFGPMILIIYFMIFRPKQKEQQAINKMLAELKKGDRVLTHSGMYGEVAAIKDAVITLKFSDNVRIDFSKSAIQKAVQDLPEVKSKA
jgi:preprotein translocase subunit YajC